MCTAFISIDPGARLPVLVLSVRDEYVGRSWSLPGRHWPARPGIVGGKDLRAGGTWLAVDPGRRRMACLLNGFGPGPAPAVRRSRGELPLAAVGEGGLEQLDLERYDPFHLVLAQPDEVRVLSWSGSRLTDRTLPPGVHAVVNNGLEGAADNRTSSGPAERMMAARLAHFRARVRTAPRPEPADGPTAAAWGAWLPIADGDRLGPDEQAALIQRRDFGDGRIWGTTSVSLVALGPERLRYDFNPAPGDDAWYEVTGPRSGDMAGAVARPGEPAGEPKPVPCGARPGDPSTP